MLKEKIVLSKIQLHFTLYNKKTEEIFFLN